jgi:predicted transglutaminase-like cysteine proteinase
MGATTEQLAQMREVNTRINAIPYEGLPGPAEPFDFWTDTPVAGDSFVCRDFVLAKSEALIADGWDKLALTVILTWTEMVMPPTNPDDPTSGREYHAVLGADAGGDVWILDSRADDIYQPSSPPFSYLWDRQQESGTVNFVDISKSGPVA